MNGLMMDWPLLIPTILRRASQFFPDKEIVSRYADRVVAFYSGRIIADGNPADVLKDPEVRRYVTGGVR